MKIKKVNTEINELSETIISVGKKPFKLWLEFENTSPWEDLTNDFANIQVDLLDGRKYSVNVWTFDFLKTSINLDSKQGEVDYQIPPDLFVKELTRDCIEKTIIDLLCKGELEELLNQSVFGLEFLNPWLDADDLNDCGKSLKDELNNELHKTHPLYGLEYDVIAKRQDNDNILIRLADNQLCVVHLTWSRKEEKENWPRTEFYLHSKDFWIRSMKETIIEYKE